MWSFFDISNFGRDLIFFDETSYFLMRPHIFNTTREGFSDKIWNFWNFSSLDETSYFLIKTAVFVPIFLCSNMRSHFQKSQIWPPDFNNPGSFERFQNFLKMRPHIFHWKFYRRLSTVFVSMRPHIKKMRPHIFQHNLRGIFWRFLFLKWDLIFWNETSYFQYNSRGLYQLKKLKFWC